MGAYVHESQNACGSPTGEAIDIIRNVQYNLCIITANKNP